MRIEPQRLVDAEHERERDVDDAAVAHRDDALARMVGDQAVERVGDPRAEDVGCLAAEVLPPLLDHGAPARIVGGLELVHRDVVVGARVPLDELLVQHEVEAVRGRDRLRGLDRASLRARHDDVDVFVREPLGEALRLLAAARGQRGIGGHAGAALDAFGFGVPNQAAGPLSVHLESEDLFRAR